MWCWLIWQWNIFLLSTLLMLTIETKESLIGCLNEQKRFSGNFQRLTVKWGIKWTFNQHIWKVFHGLSIDVLHDQKDFLQYFGWLSPSRPMGVQRATTRPIFFIIWKYKSEPLSMSKISFLSPSVWTCSPEKNRYKKQFSGHFQLLTVKWVVKWTFNWPIWVELFMCFRLMSHDPKRF